MDSITIQKGFKPGDRVVTDGQAYQSPAHKSEESQERGAVMLLAKVDRAVGKVAKHGECDNTRIIWRSLRHSEWLASH